jgi:hypothetical protein
VKRGIGFKRRIAGLCSLLVLHAIGMSGGSVMAQGVNLPVAASVTAMPAEHCEHSAALAAPTEMLAYAAQTDHSPPVSGCSGCCKVQHGCPVGCACPASAAHVSAQLSVPPQVAPIAVMHFAITAHPPQPPLRIFRPPIA